MPAPIIDPTTSVLGYRAGTRWNYQPATTNTPAATSWACTGLPAGITINAATGLISGAATEEGVFLASLTATNGDGTSAPFILTIGIFEKLWRDEGALPINVDLRTGRVYPHNNTNWKPGDWVIFGKTGDKFLVEIGYTADGGQTCVPVQPVTLKVGLREFDTSPVLWVSSGDFEMFTSGGVTRYRIVLDLTGAAVARAVRNYEDDYGTWVEALAEIELVQNIVMNGEAVLLRKTSQHFSFRIAKEMVPNA
jgi:hypothetical protein